MMLWCLSKWKQRRISFKSKTEFSIDEPYHLQLLLSIRVSLMQLLLRLLRKYWSYLNSMEELLTTFTMRHYLSLSRPRATIVRSQRLKIFLEQNWRRNRTFSLITSINNYFFSNNFIIFYSWDSQSKRLSGLTKRI